jgi:hypothetical protein
VSALWTGLTGWQSPDPVGVRGDSERTLRPVPAAPPRLARRPFAVVLIVLFGVGMTGLLMLNTTLQNQAFASRSLNRQATQLAHVQVDLQTQLDTMAAAPELARRASDLGMRANPKPAFLVVPSGKVIGKTYRVKGNEMPGLVVKTERQLAADDAKTAAKRARRAADKVAATRAQALQADNRAIAAAEAKAQADKAASDAAKADGTTAAGAQAGGTGKQAPGQKKSKQNTSTQKSEPSSGGNR